MCLVTSSMQFNAVNKVVFFAVRSALEYSSTKDDSFFSTFFGRILQSKGRIVKGGSN